MFSDNALKVLEKRYFLRDEAGKLIEDVSSLFERVARAVASRINLKSRLRQLELDRSCLSF